MLKEKFEHDGYLIIENFIPENICDNLIAHTLAQVDNFDLTSLTLKFSTKTHEHSQQDYFLNSGKKIHYFLEEKLDEGTPRLNKIGHGLHLLDPVFKTFCRQEKIQSLLQELDVTNPQIMQSMYIFKHPKVGGEVSPHQDSTFLYVHGRPITGLWFALEDATVNNGCLWAIPRGHRSTLKSRMIRRENNISFETYDESPWDLEKMEPLAVKKGSLIVLHGLLPHMSKENKSHHSRHAFTMHVMSGEDTFAEDNWLQV